MVKLWPILPPRVIFWVCGPAAADVCIYDHDPPKAKMTALGGAPDWGHVVVQGLSTAGSKPLFGSMGKLA